MRNPGILSFLAENMVHFVPFTVKFTQVANWLTLRWASRFAAVVK